MGTLLDLAKQTRPDSDQTRVDLQATASPLFDPSADSRKSLALDYLKANPRVKRVCFADAKADPENIVLTVGVRDPWGAVEVLVSRDKFDAFAMIELNLRYQDSSLFIPEH